MLSVALASRRVKSCPLSRTDFYRVTQRLLAAMRAGSSDASRRLAWSEPAQSVPSSSLFGRVVVSIPANSFRAVAPGRLEGLMFIFDELFLERGGRQDKQNPKPLYSSTGADDLCKTGLDGPRPILNLARDALEHRLQFC